MSHLSLHNHGVFNPPSSILSVKGSLPTALSDPRRATMSPLTTGASVVGVTFNGGVVLAADVLGSYGSLARFRDVRRLMKINESTALGVGGDVADFQYLKDIVDNKMIEEHNHADGFGLSPVSLHCWLTRVLYNRRSKFDPLWITGVVGGLQDGKPYLGYVDKIGTAFTAPEIASGFGTHLSLPVLRAAREENPNMGVEEAQRVIKNCIRILFYRDARAFNKYQMATVTAAGCEISDVLEIDSDWSVGHMVKGY